MYPYVPKGAERGGAATMYPEYKPNATVALARADVAKNAKRPATTDAFTVLPIRGNVYMISGAGANITASVGKDGIVLVDTGRADMSDKVLQALRGGEATATVFAHENVLTRMSAPDYEPPVP